MSPKDQRILMDTLDTINRKYEADKLTSAVARRITGQVASVVGILAAQSMSEGS